MEKRRASIRRFPGDKGAKGVLSPPGVVRWIRSGALQVLLVLAITAVISLFFLSFYDYLLTSPYMKLEKVEMQGVDVKIRSELIDSCGLNSDKGLLGLKLNELKKRMEEHPWVRSVRLERRFPSTLIVEAETESPVALVVVDGIHYMNQWGEVFKEVSGSDDIDLPVITGLSGLGPDTRGQLHRASRVIKVLKSENGPWSLRELSEIHLKEDGEISLYFNHLKAEIRSMWNDLGSKMEGLKRVAEHLNRSGKIKHVIHIDLNYADGAVVSFGKS